MVPDSSSHIGGSRLDRRAKAEKIIRLSLGGVSSGTRILDIGCGHGYMSERFSEIAGPSGAVFAVDVLDERQGRVGFTFVRVSGLELPFAEGEFDLIVSNHVIEHVGDDAAQVAHLAEIGRLLAPGGTAYVAAPSRWKLWESHFNLPFVSWLPRKISDSYVRLLGRGECYDVNPPTRSRLLSVIPNYLEVEDVSLENVFEEVMLKWPRLSVLSRWPDCLRPLNRCIPVIALRIKKPIAYDPGTV